MTPWEYNLRTKAHLLKENDMERRVYTTAFANRLFKAEKKGRYLIKDVKSIYDYEQNEQKILSEFSKESTEKLAKKEDLYEMRERLLRAQSLVAKRKQGKEEKNGSSK
ncbi:hypothetical protein [Enterococcus rivorum]|uniref:Uncharacterized protein n=1 Tax=Enterococcus rivorum TaxID=762845 RepID=A0A1E5KZG0_9ENTE|nr:hypothetical protein [Enterococcus rivorum]MBP2099350.1 hypothetical protein [Enterococcus rivorum]OEH83215.1 hypothetical protein BCR26_10450 [Enterococcus rivorum]